MGSDDGNSEDAEKPARQVTISSGYWMGKYEVTQEQWKKIMRANPSQHKGRDLPVETVSWFEAKEFCRKLTDQETKAGRLPEGYEYRLPTEAEWEYAARAGETKDYRKDDTNALISLGWFRIGDTTGTHPIGGKQANPWGFFDMRGNVWEMCEDWYGDYDSDPAVDPQGPANGKNRVLRGGSHFEYSSWHPRLSCRGFTRPEMKGVDGGFRVVAAHRLRIAVTVTKKGASSVVGGSNCQRTTNTATQHSLVTANYCVVDLSGGPQASSYPLSYLDSAPDLSDDYKTSKMLLRHVPAGTFLMGSIDNKSDSGGNSSERPAHQVTLCHGFYIAVYETTQAQYSNVMGTCPTCNSKASQGETRPVEGVSLKTIRGRIAPEDTPEVWTFLGKLRTRTGIEFDLPSEAQWEYACRVGSTGMWCFGDNELLLDDYAWYSKNSGSATQPVGQKKPNAWGLYDMHGNAAEQCKDWCDFYSNESAANPVGHRSRIEHSEAKRGGSCGSSAKGCRAFIRNIPEDLFSRSTTGFRCVAPSM